MAALTTRLGLYLPGGGSLGIGGDDEVADIDRINENFEKLDEMVGAAAATRVGTPNPIDGQIVREDNDLYAWDSATGTWTQINPHVGTTAPTNPQEGYLWVDTN